MKMEWVQTLAAGLSAVAAIAAAIAAIFGPIRAAQIAERLRRTTQAENELRQMKLSILGTLMRERTRIYSTDSVGALNLIDLVFAESKEVRDAWAKLYQSFDRSVGLPNHVRDERHIALLKAISSDLNLGSTLREDDFWRIYRPTAMADEDHIQTLQRQAALAELQARLGNQGESDQPPAEK